jgi:hypothetical protein
MQYQDDMTSMFDALTELTLQQRAAIKERYRFLMSEYRYRCRQYAALFYVLRITMTVGSLAVPALLSLKTTGPDGEAILYWFTWGLSLAVTTANGILTLFKLDKRFFLLHAIAERIRTETWQYLSLSGRYSGHYGGHRPTHRNQYVFYFSRIERIRMNHIDEEYVRQADIGDGSSKQQQQQPVQLGLKGGTGQEDTIRDTIGAGVPSPPDQAALIATPDTKTARPLPTNAEPDAEEDAVQQPAKSMPSVGAGDEIILHIGEGPAPPTDAQTTKSLSMPGHARRAVSATSGAGNTVLRDTPKL